jgi:hypothetical protein
VVQTDTLMTVLDVAHRQAQTLSEVHEQLLEFFTSLKLLRLETVRTIIDKYDIIPLPHSFSSSISLCLSYIFCLLQRRDRIQNTTESQGLHMRGFRD